MEFIEKGADLMLPGVHVLSDYLFPEFAKGCAIAVAIYYRDTDTFSPIAIGTSLMSSADMFSSGMKGKGVEILHMFQDKLWEFGSKSKPVRIPLNKIYKLKNSPSADIPEINQLDVVDNEENELNEQEVDDQKSQPSTALEQEETPVNMDELLANVFFWSLKKHGKEVSLPIDVGQFYANYILKQLPEGVRIDLKKTSFKKFSKFLEKMNENEPLVKITSKKGLDSIQEINFESDLVKNAVVPFEGLEEQEVNKKTDHPRVSECFSVTEAVLPFFKPYGYKRGDVLQQNQLRDMVVQYGTEKNLLTEDKKKIELDDMLQTLARHFLPDKVGINELVQKVGSQMTKAFVVTLPDGRRNIRRDKMVSIQMSVEKRAGKKVVTLLNNTSFFGIDAKAFSKKLQVALATSVTINQEVPNCEGPQLLLHGNHVFYIGELLQNEYGIQKKFIKGLELGIKKKNK
ncbi:PUA and Translation initiation factor SUI1 domain containing protein [Aphelenchoides bicaudatus]|nr:PUA and Translation initiation factor SUI1 domain containing protein [Aphelenchoides bicaudatus]